MQTTTVPLRLQRLQKDSSVTLGGKKRKKFAPKKAAAAGKGFVPISDEETVHKTEAKAQNRESKRDIENVTGKGKKKFVRKPIKMGQVAFSVGANLHQKVESAVIDKIGKEDENLGEDWPPALTSEKQPMTLPYRMSETSKLRATAACPDPVRTCPIHEDSDLESQLVYVQLPSKFPSSAVLGTSSIKTDEKRVGDQSTFQSTLKKVSYSGEIGNLMVMESGKIKLQLGDVLYDVTNAINCKFHQEVGVIKTEEDNALSSNGRFFSIGPVNRRLQLIPDIEDLVHTFLEDKKKM